MDLRMMPYACLATLVMTLSLINAQVIRIMDRIWNREGMDLRMMPYACLATGSQVS